MLKIPSSFVSPPVYRNDCLGTLVKAELQTLPADFVRSRRSRRVFTTSSSSRCLLSYTNNELAQDIAVAAAARSNDDQIFEPQVNLPALSAFLTIAVIFTLLQIRINGVRDASEQRIEALNKLRQIKSAQLDPSSSDSSSNRKPNEEQVNEAIAEYKSALEQELALRTIVPGVRIVAPNDPKRNEADIAAAKQFLGLDFDAKEVMWMDNDNDDSSMEKKKEASSRQGKNELLLQSRRRFDGKVGGEISRDDDTGNVGLSDGNKAILLLIAIVQIGLLIVLSFDPMTAQNVFTFLGDEFVL